MTTLEQIIKRFIYDYPNEEDSERIECIETRENLFKGNYSKEFLEDYIQRLCSAGVTYSEMIGEKKMVHHSPNSLTGRKKVEAMLRSYNLVKPICNIKNRFTFGKDLKISDVENDLWLNGEENSIEDGFIDRSKFYTEIYKAGLGGQYRGDSVIYLWRNEEGLAQLSVKSAKYWVAVPMQEDKNKVLANCIVEEFAKNKDDKTNAKDIVYKITASIPGETYYFAIKKSEGKNEIIEWDNELLGELENVTEVLALTGVKLEITGLNYPVIFRVPNIPLDDSIYGTTDFDETVISQLREIFIRMSQNGRIADKNTDPLLTGPLPMVSETENGQTIIETSSKYLARDKEDVEPKYIEFGGNMLDKSNEIIKQAIECIYGMCGVNAAALGATQEGLSALTGTAIEKVYATPIAEGNRQWQLWHPILKDILKCAYQMETGQDTLMPSISRESGLPKTDKERIEVALLENGNKAIKSQKTSIIESGKTEEQAITEIEQILEENKAEANSLSGDLQFGEGEGDEE